MMLLDLAPIVLGAVIVLAGLHDVFRTLVHPVGRGRVSRWVMAAGWKSTARLGRRGRSAGGPAATFTVVLAWAILQIVGWALIYLPFVPQGFAYSPGLDPDRYHPFAEAVYVSVTSLATLGFGDVVPVHQWLRVLAPLQALTGFALLTGAVSWMLQVFPALARRRALAVRLHALRVVSYPDELPALAAGPAVTVLDSLAAQLAVVRVDLSQTPESYYFREGDAPSALGHNIGVVLRLVEASATAPDPAVRKSGEVLDAALRELLEYLRSQFLQKSTTDDDVLRAFAREHD